MPANELFPLLQSTLLLCFAAQNSTYGDQNKTVLRRAAASTVNLLVEGEYSLLKGKRHISSLHRALPSCKRVRQNREFANVLSLERHKSNLEALENCCRNHVQL